jgi:hypothetical protein
MYFKTYYGAVVKVIRDKTQTKLEIETKNSTHPFKISVSGSQSKEPLDGI